MEQQNSFSFSSPNKTTYSHDNLSMDLLNKIEMNNLPGLAKLDFNQRRPSQVFNKETEPQINQLKQELELIGWQKIEILSADSHRIILSAQKQSSNLRVALKCMEKHNEQFQIFLNEIDLHQKCSNSCVLPFLEVFQTENFHVMATELCKGTIQDLIENEDNQKHLNEISFIYYSRQIAQGLRYLHQDLNMVHRDLKPENILISFDDKVYISDLGLAKIVMPQDINESLFKGNILYNSPQVIWNKQQQNQESDLYSLGCIMLQMLEGINLIVQKKQNEESELVFKQCKDFICFKEIEKIINSLMNKEPENRMIIQKVLKELEKIWEKYLEHTRILEANRNAMDQDHILINANQQSQDYKDNIRVSEDTRMLKITERLQQNCLDKSNQMLTDLGTAIRWANYRDYILPGPDFGFAYKTIKVLHLLGYLFSSKRTPVAQVFSDGDAMFFEKAAEKYLSEFALNHRGFVFDDEKYLKAQEFYMKLEEERKSIERLVGSINKVEKRNKKGE